MGGVVKAFVVLVDGHEPTVETAQAIQQHVRAKLSAYHYPRLVEFVPSLPKTLTGKIRRIELREAEAARPANRSTRPRGSARRPARAPVRPTAARGPTMSMLTTTGGGGVERACTR